MMRSMFSGVSGLKAHQTKMDVIGNNISNVNTVGFKASRVTFSDVFYQTTQSASGPNPSTGMAGRNAMQIGLGSNVAAISTSISTTGASQRTDDPFDIMIEGDAFFIVNSGGVNHFTKAGNFDIDANGNLTTPTGALVMGWQVDDNDPNRTVADVVSPLTIMSPENLYAVPEATTEVYISGNIDSKDTQIASGNGRPLNVTFYDKMGHSYSADLRVEQSENETNEYRVSIADIKDESGLSIFVTKNVDNTTGEITYGPSSITTFTFGTTTYNATVNEDDGSVSFNNENPPVITFSGSTGAYTGIKGEDGGDKIALTISADAGAGDANPFSPINIDFSSLTMYSTSGSSSLEANRGSLDGLGAGKKVGNMTGVNIDGSGKIYGRYDNGDSRLLGQIAVATFSNPAGLEAVGNSMFVETQNSGQFDGIGQDPTQGGGSLTTGVLEMSNVDLASEFTDMITTQRGFQANSRIITTSDTLLEELINLKR